VVDSVSLHEPHTCRTFFQLLQLARVCLAHRCIATSVMFAVNLIYWQHHALYLSYRSKTRVKAEIVGRAITVLVHASITGQVSSPRCHVTMHKKLA